MDWATFAASTSAAAVISAAISFGFARVNARLDRRIETKEREAAREADWEMPHDSGVFWLLRNCGDADALDVHLDLVNIHPLHGMTYDWPKIPRDESERIGLSLDRSQRGGEKV